MTRMFKFVKRTWNPFVGCGWDCKYCWARKMAKRLPCEKCKKFIPHFHPERFKRIPKSGFVFVGDMGDLWWAAYVSQGPEYHLLLDDLLDLITEALQKAKKARKRLAFFFETKAPEVYQQYWPIDEWDGYEVWASVTIETNRAELTRQFSKAPDPEKRFRDMYWFALDWPITHVSIEPIMDFDLDVMLEWIECIEPFKVSIGYDNYGHKLPEPPLSKTRELIRRLKKIRYMEVEVKTLRKAWYEK